VPTSGPAYFVELVLSRHGKVVDRNVYWRSTKADVVDWGATQGNPQATMTSYADLSALRTLPRTSVDAKAVSGHGTTSVTITNRSDKVAFFLRADIPGDRWATWDDNDITLWPGESQTITATHDPAGTRPSVRLSGFNTATVTVE
jgi:exo-1,4-beta-D-glucosaminidase